MMNDDDMNQLAKKIEELPSIQLEIRKPTLPGITAISKIPRFVGPRSILLFSLLKVDHTFLRKDDWRHTPEYATITNAVVNLYPVNDSAKRALNMATTYNGKITKDEDSFQKLVLVVEAHLKKHGVKTKSDF